MYVVKGVVSLVRAVPLAVVAYLVFVGVLWALGRRRALSKRTAVKELALFVYAAAILSITGLIGAQLRLDWFVNSLGSIGLGFPSSRGELAMVALNLLMFVPFGFLAAAVFRRGWITALLIGGGFSIAIEFLQMFSGRMAELNDVAANSVGALAGYFVYRLWVRYAQRGRAKNMPACQDA